MDKSHDAITQRRERLLTEENIARLIISLSLPLFVSGSIQNLYNIVDTFWLSRLGPAALGTPTVSWPFMGVLMSIGFGLASSVSALVGQYVGARDYRMASKSLGNVLGLLMAIGVPGALLFYAGRSLYMDVTRVTPEMLSYVDSYIAVTIAGVPFMYLFLTFNFALSAIGDTVTPTKVSIASTLLNFALDPVLIFEAGLGVMGAALATLISNIVAGAYAAYSFATGRHGLRVYPADLVPDRLLAGLIARISAPMVASRLMTVFGFIVMVGIVNGLGTPVVAAYSIGQVMLNIDHVLSFPIARATSIIVAQSLGARLIDRAKRTAKTGLLLLAAFIGVYIVGLVLFRSAFISIFTKDPSVVGPANRMLLIFGPSVLGFDLFILGNSIARASGHTLFMSVIGIGRLWILRIPLSYYLAYTLGLGDLGLWTGMSLSNWITGMASVAWILSWKWAKPVIKPTPVPPAD
ncbi:MAG: MATE family efflux transporter [Desulfurococcales archaeon]|nr:MATE family efflux transporter [Desulfurococcales archaeon]